MREEHRLNMSGKRVLKRLQRDEIIGDWRKLNNEEPPVVLFANFY
jgi:hypothetical protein